MTLSALDHCSIRTTHLPETRAFFVDVLGMEDGARPNFDFPGHWLYIGDKPVVHLIGIDEESPEGLEAYLGGTVDPDALEADSGAFDHIAFRAKDPAVLIKRLRENKYEYRERMVPDLELFQIFVEDPNGVTVELNYFDAEQKAA